MFRAAERGGNWFVETDEAAPLDYLRGLPDAGHGWPWATACNGQKVGGADATHMQVAQGFDKQTATAFEVDDEAYLRALALSSAFDSAPASVRVKAEQIARR